MKNRLRIYPLLDSDVHFVLSLFIVNDDKIYRTNFSSCPYLSHPTTQTFDTSKQSNLSFFCGSSSSKLASLTFCWELLHDFIYGCFLFQTVMIYLGVFGKQFGETRLSILAQKKKLIAHHPFSTTSSNCLHKEQNALNSGDKK